MPISREGRICSFCATPGGPGTDLSLVGGLGAQICVPCVEHFHALVQDAEQVSAKRKTLPWERMDDTELLATLPQILASAEQNASFAQEWVDMLRGRGITWAEIGRVLGVSRQAAWERFTKKPARKSASA
ncbi:hypothetical protein [Nocardioides zeicaulis]|uniref:ATP-dependent Clp protease ATP-binding subunit ClpX zinc ribbon domain-containing protein n=1 Tax=Nocardioides zeicaulis TaxID=1776857 RepID=A0ABV6E1P3_9ACTN